mgnify:FL=1
MTASRVSDSDSASLREVEHGGKGARDNDALDARGLLGGKEGLTSTLDGGVEHVGDVVLDSVVAAGAGQPSCETSGSRSRTYNGDAVCARMVTPLMASSNAPGSIMSLTSCSAMFRSVVFSTATATTTHGPLERALSGRVLGHPLVDLGLRASGSADLEALLDVGEDDLSGDARSVSVLRFARARRPALQRPLWEQAEDKRGFEAHLSAEESGGCSRGQCQIKQGELGEELGDGGRTQTDLR